MSTNPVAALDADSTKRQFVTFRVQAKRYGVPIESVAEMTQIQDFYPISGAPTWILGMMQLRDSVVPILDLRLRLGLTRLQEELEALSCQLMRHRDEHLEWIDTLPSENARRDASGHEMGSRTCGLRAWLESREAAEGSLTGPIERLQTPDERLHVLVESSRELAARGDADVSRRALDRARGIELKDLLQGFDGVMREIRARGRQMVVILRGAQEDLAIAVDHIDSVASVDVDQIVPRPLHDLDASDAANDLLISSVVRKHDHSDLVQILDVERIFRSAGVGPAERAWVRPVDEGDATDVGGASRFA